MPRHSNTIVFCAIDELAPAGRPISGLADFLATLQEESIPCVWSTSRNRHQLDAVLRKLGHSAPFIGENGCGVFLPEDYFHLKPTRPTIRLGRYTCIPVASLLPAATNTLDLLAEESEIEVVTLRSLSPRELSQNAGLPQREAELLRQRDFDELFFFAGASDEQIASFATRAGSRNADVRRSEQFWSLAVGANLKVCVQQLAGLYERALKTKPTLLALSTLNDFHGLNAACGRAIVLLGRNDAEPDPLPNQRPPLCLPLFSPETWEKLPELILTRQI